MSGIVGGAGNVFIANGQTQGWTVTWNNGGWQGNMLLEPQPLNTGANISYSEGSVFLNSNGAYSFTCTLRNSGPNSTFFNLQYSSN